jgi:hypothetical protein
MDGQLLAAFAPTVIESKCSAGGDENQIEFYPSLHLPIEMHRIMNDTILI